MNEYELIKEIGERRFGKVNLYSKKKNQEHYVVKKIKVINNNESVKREVMQEMKIMKELNEGIKA